MIWAIAVCFGKSVPAEQALRRRSALLAWERASGRGVSRDAKGGYLY